ncbi:MAG TPA: LamG domain-containing protein [Verrucomicrobiae bacterium]|nr:LamG domain-containing protein [Verrucomicrobiae bacterium]
MDQAQITWDVEFEDQPAFGRTFTVKPRPTIGDTLVEAEAVLPDGRRVFGRRYLHFNDPVNGGTEFTLPDANTVALYHFNDASAFPQTIPDSKNGYNLTVPVNGGFPDPFTNNSWMKTPLATSKVARFGATGDEIWSSVQIPYSALPLPTGGLTIEFRIYVKSLPYYASGLYLFRLAQGDSGNVSEWSIKYQNQVAPLLQVLAPSGQVVLDPNGWNARITLNTWHLVKITFAPSGQFAGTTTLYIDGAQAGSLSSSTYFDPGSTWNLRMGNFVGCIDELRISNTVR